MTTFLAIIIGIITLLLLITAHEFAHFVIAKISGAYIYEFSIGFGPKIVQWGKKETRYTIRLLPLGGYVSIASELEDAAEGRENEVIEPKRFLENLPRGKKAAFIASGTIMNLLIAIIFLIIAYAIFPYKLNFDLQPTFNNHGLIYEAVKKYNNEHPTKPILENEKIIMFKNIKVAGSEQQIKNYRNDEEWISKFYKKNADKTIEVKFENTEIVTVKSDTDKNDLGILPSSIKLTNSQIVGDTFVDTFKNSISILKALGQLVTFKWSNISGPVGIVKSTNVFLNTHNTEKSISYYFRWTALLSANLFLFNLLPIPPFDGYKFVENAVEAITRKKINTKFKIIVSAAGAILFLFLIIAITIKDIFL